MTSSQQMGECNPFDVSDLVFVSRAFAEFNPKGNQRVMEIPGYRFQYVTQAPLGHELPESLSPATALGVRAFHRQLPGYTPTPLARLERLARAWGFGDIFVKNEAPDSWIVLWIIDG
jgi:hypothetical protein